MTRQEAIETIRMAISQVEWEYPMDYAVAFDMAVEALSQPKIIRCKECKYGLMMENGEVKCDELCTDDDGYPMVLYQNADWYCANGERQETK